MIKSILALLFAILFLIVGLPVYGILSLLQKFNKKFSDKKSLEVVQWAFRCILSICQTEVEVKGKELLPKDTPVLYIANHNSYFDVIIGYSQCDRLTGFIAKQEVSKIPILKLWMERLYCLFLDRDNLKQGMQVILTSISYIKKGISIWIFPEGTRSKTGEMLPFKDGSFKIATKTGCPIIPVAFTHTADILENHFPFVKKTTVTMRYGAPIDPTQLSEENKKHIGSYVQNVIQEMIEEETSISS